MTIGGISGSQPDFLAMRAKMDERMSARFVSNDADQNGGLSFDEFSQAHANRAEGRGGVGGPRPGGHHGGSGGAESISETDKVTLVENLFAKLDTDENGEITEEEIKAARPPKPPAPHGNFSNDMMSMLLSAQEETNGSVMDMLTSLSDEDSDEDENSSILSMLENAARRI